MAMLFELLAVGSPTPTVPVAERETRRSWHVTGSRVADGYAATDFSAETLVLQGQRQDESDVECHLEPSRGCRLKGSQATPPVFFPSF